MLSFILCASTIMSVDYCSEALLRVHLAAVNNKLERHYESTFAEFRDKPSLKADVDYLVTFYVYYRQILYGARRIPKNGLHEQITAVLPRLEKAALSSKSDSFTAFHGLVLLTNTKNGFKTVKNKKEGKFSIREFSVDVTQKFHKLIDPILSTNDKLPIARFTNASYRFYSEAKVTEEQLRYLSETADICRDTPWELESYNYLLMNETAKYGKFSNASQERALAALKKYKGTIYAEAWEQTRNWWESNKY